MALDGDRDGDGDKLNSYHITIALYRTSIIKTTSDKVDDPSIVNNLHKR